MTEHRKIDRLFGLSVVGFLFLFSLGIALLFGRFEYIPRDGWHFWQVVKGSFVIAIAFLWVKTGIAALELRDETLELRDEVRRSVLPCPTRET